MRLRVQIVHAKGVYFISIDVSIDAEGIQGRNFLLRNSFYTGVIAPACILKNGEYGCMFRNNGGYSGNGSVGKTMVSGGIQAASGPGIFISELNGIGELRPKRRVAYLNDVRIIIFWKDPDIYFVGAVNAPVEKGGELIPLIDLVA